MDENTQYRKEFAELVGAVIDDSNDDTTVSFSMVATDVTGSLGVWGITQ